MVQLKPIISTALSSKRPPFRIKRAWRMQGRLHRWLQVQGRTPRVVGAWGLGVGMVEDRWRFEWEYHWILVGGFNHLEKY